MATVGAIFFACRASCSSANRFQEKFFNPLVKPCVDKVTQELMILGAIAFTVTIFDELLDFKTFPWAHTLHFVDVLIFLFALIYVGFSIYVLNLIGAGTDWLAIIDSKSMRQILDEFRGGGGKAGGNKGRASLWRHIIARARPW